MQHLAPCEPGSLEEKPVQTSVLLGLELTPLGIGTVGIFGICMCALGYFVAKTSRPTKTAEGGLLFAPPHPATRKLTGAASEQREYPRYETQPFPLRITLNQDGHEIEGLVLNQSLGGLCICVQKNLPEGAVLDLRGTENSGYRLQSQVIIKHCRPHRGGWALGCQYV